MTINESVVDRRISDAIRYDKSSDTSAKCAALAASYIVGKYDHGTAQIAKARKRSVSTVENWAHAAWMYQYAKTQADVRVVRNLWHWLPVSHWWMAWDEIHQRGGAALYYLSMADTHGWSGRRMIKEFQVDYEREHGTPPPPPIGNVYNRAVNVAADMLARITEVDARVVQWARDGMRLFDELGVVEAKE